MNKWTCGCDYSTTGYTTRQEAHRMAMLLDLQSSDRLLDVGAGSGWPGLHFSQETGCDVVLVDLPIDRLSDERESGTRFYFGAQPCRRCRRFPASVS